MSAKDSPAYDRSPLQCWTIPGYIPDVGQISARNFGLFIAYLLPGFVAIWGLSMLSAPVRLWLVGVAGEGPNAAGVVYALLASMAAGMTASAMRWALVDSVHHRTGILPPAWDDSKLQERLEAFESLVGNHYRYSQFYGNTLCAGLFAYVAWRVSPASDGIAWGLPELALLSLAALFVGGSRDALRRYYSRTASLLGSMERTVAHDERSQPRDEEHSEAPAETTIGCGEDSGESRKPATE